MVGRTVKQGEIVEVPCSLPGERSKVHMVLVVSTDKLLEAEPGMFYGVMITTENYHPEYTVEITEDMLTKPLLDKSYFATHIMSFFDTSEIMKSCRTAIKPEHLDDLIEKIIDSIFN